MEIMKENNKAVVRRFNKEVIEEGNIGSFNTLMAGDFVNRSAPANMDKGPQGMLYFFNEVLRPAMSNIRVTIHQQIAEEDLVTTRKTISGTHTGQLLGISSTGQIVNIEVIDIIRIKDGKYFEHWGITSLSEVLAQLNNKA